MDAMTLKEFLLRDLYPATKSHLLAEAERLGLDPAEYRRLEQLPDREYDTVADVGMELNAAA